MTDITASQYNDFYHTDNGQFTFHNMMPTEKVQRRLSFSTLLQKRASLMMGRKLSIFTRQKKPQLKVMIPTIVQDNSLLERTDTSASTSTDGDGPLTPTTPTSSLYYNKQQVSLDDLETALTTTSNTVPLKDFSGKGYSNFYIKLPNGNWMVRVRDGNRKIVATYEINGSMI